MRIAGVTRSASLSGAMHRPAFSPGSSATKMSLMLMDWPPVSDGPPIRDGRPYCQIAHLARRGIPFIAVSDWLRLKAGLSAPAVAAYDLDRGLFLVKDLGDAVFGTLIAGRRAA